MEQSILNITAVSPEDLEKILREMKQTDGKACRFVSLALHDPGILVSPFSFDAVSIIDLLSTKKNVKSPASVGNEGCPPAGEAGRFNIKKEKVNKELKTKLMFEAVGLLSLPVEDIELDYQILTSENQKLSGILICMPKILFNEYLQVTEKLNFVPVKMTSGILLDMDFILDQLQGKTGRFCVISFYKDTVIHLAVFHDGRCELVREIPYEDHNEAYTEVLQSLRSVYAKSSEKKCGQIFYCGNLSGKDDLIEMFSRDFKSEIFQKKAAKGLSFTPRNFFNLNLMRNHAVSLKERSSAIAYMRYIIIFALLACVYSLFHILSIDRETKTIKGSYTKSDYEYAKRLQQQVKSLKL